MSTPSRMPSACGKRQLPRMDEGCAVWAALVHASPRGETPEGRTTPGSRGARGLGGLRGGLGLARRPWPNALGLWLAWGPQEAVVQEIQVRAAKHLPLQHFQTVDVALDRPGTPRQGDAGFDRLIVVAEPGRKALHGLQGTGGCTLEPRIELVRLPLAYQSGKVLREVDRLSDLGLLGPQLGQLLRLSPSALLLTAEDEPRRPAGRQGLGDRLCHHRQELAPALAAGGDALGLAEAADIRGDTAIAPGVAPQVDLPKQLDGGVAAGVPALQDIGLIRVEDAASIVAAMLPHRPRRQVQIPLDGATAAAHLGGNGHARPALAVEGPDLLVARPSLRRALGGLLFRAGGDGRP